MGAGGPYLPARALQPAYVAKKHRYPLTGRRRLDAARGLVLRGDSSEWWSLWPVLHSNSQFHRAFYSRLMSQAVPRNDRYRVQLCTISEGLCQEIWARLGGGELDGLRE